MSQLVPLKPALHTHAPRPQSQYPLLHPPGHFASHSFSFSAGTNAQLIFGMSGSPPTVDGHAPLPHAFGPGPAVPPHNGRSIGIGPCIQSRSCCDVTLLPHSRPATVSLISSAFHRFPNTESLNSMIQSEEIRRRSYEVLCVTMHGSSSRSSSSSSRGIQA